MNKNGKVPEIRNRSMYVRIYEIDQLLRAGRRPTAAYLSKKFERSVRSISRDIQFMRDSLGLPLECTSTRNGYYHYTKTPPPLPGVPFTEGDLFGFCVLEQMMSLFRGTQLEAQLRSTFEKIAASLKDEISVSWNALAEAISFQTTTTPIREDPEVLETLSRALRQEEVEFLYSSLQSDKTELRRVEPYHFLIRDGIWYVFAYDPMRQDTRCFALVRMKELRTTGRFFEMDERHTDPDTKLQHSIGVFGGDKPELVRLRLTPLGARLFSERSYHPTQKITRTDDGGYELSMIVYINPELERMLMSHFREVKVLEPEPLRQQLLENARQMLNWANEPA